MNELIRVVVVDDNEVLLSSIKTYFKDCENIKVVATFKDGREALNYLVNFQSCYDVVLLDIILKHIDGLKIMEELNDNNINKNIMVLSSFKDDFTIRKVQELGGKYYMLKPISMDLIKERILDLYSHHYDIVNDKAFSMEREVSNLLHDLGIPSHIKGYAYIREGIMIIYAKDTPDVLLTKEVYPILAENFDTTPTRVERAIRHAIEISWIRGDIGKMDELFGNSLDIDKSRPTNSEFLLTLADRFKVNSRIVG